MHTNSPTIASPILPYLHIAVADAYLISVRSNVRQTPIHMLCYKGVSAQHT
jgi:hypothetical protein